MKTVSRIALCGALLLAGLAGTATATADTDEGLAMKLVRSIEKYYGQNLAQVDSFLKQKYGIAGPMRKEGNKYTYMLPMKSPTCGSLLLFTDQNKVVDWHAMTWERTEDNMYGKACDDAFKHAKR